MDGLRNEVQNVLAGLGPGIGGGADDPFNDANEESRGKKAGGRPEGQPNERRFDKPKSRRAQQEQARAASAPKEAAGQAAAVAQKGQKSRRPQPVNVPAWAPPKPNAAALVLPVCATWWEEAVPAPVEAAKASDEQVRGWRVEAEQLYERELGAFAARQQRQHGADHRMVQRLLTGGTWKDRVAALTVQSQESAYHALPWVRQLLALAQRPARDVQMKAVEALSELFLGRLLPQRRLRPFEKQPLPAQPSERQLMQAWYEESLKNCYAGFAQLVVHGTTDNVLHSKQQMIKVLHDMLNGAPELERELLPALVNKLGDPEKKVASRLTHLLHTTSQRHPAMRAVLLAELQRFVLRPGMAERALYYACTFLNQVILSRREPETAQQLLRIYLALFAARSGGDQPLDTRMLASLLSGIHRAVPFCSAPGELLLGQLASLFRCAHSANLSTAVQALMVLAHASTFDPATEDRFYRALYEALLHPELPSSAKQALLLNVVFKAMKADADPARVRAYAKRLMQACANASPSFICGCLLLLSEVSKAVPALQAMVTQPQPPPKAPPKPKDGAAAAAKASGNGNGEGGSGGAAAAVAEESYAWDKRDPRHAGAEGAGLWEAAQLLHHYHPSVQQFAAALLNGNGIKYAGDPLRDFQLTPFLDKFVFKNPKAQKGHAGGSLMQPAAKPKPGMSTAEMARLAELSAANVDEHDRFFHTYFAGKKAAEEKALAKRSKGKKKPAAVGDDGAAADADGDDEEEAFARKLAVGMLQDGPGGGDSDDDDDDDDDLAAFEGMDDSDDDDDDEFDDDDDEGGFGMEGGDDEEEDEEAAAAEAAAASAKPKKKKREKSASTFASADEFSEMLEAAADEYEGVNPHLADWEEGRSRKKERRK